MSLINNDSLAIVPYVAQGRVANPSCSIAQKSLKDRVQSRMDVAENEYLNIYKALQSTTFRREGNVRE